MNILPIKTEADYESTLKRVEELFQAVPDTPEGDELEILITLVMAYEEVHHKINAPDPIAAIQHVMEAQGLTRSDVTNIFGEKGRTSQILNKKRPLSINMIRRAKKELNIPASVLIQEYKTLQNAEV